MVSSVENKEEKGDKMEPKVEEKQIAPEGSSLANDAAKEEDDKQIVEKKGEDESMEPKKSA